MTRRDLPSGFRAVHRGRRYLADGGRGGQVTLRDDQTGAEMGRVPIEELDEWYRVRTVGTYLGEPFRVDAEIDGSRYLITFDGGNGRGIAEEWAARQHAADGSTYWREDQYTFMAEVPRGDVHDVHEVRLDELGPWRAARAAREEREER